MAATYRRVLRAARDVFRGDELALRESRRALREEFEKTRGERDPERIGQALRNADEAEDFLRNHLVQARRTKRGSYAVQLKAPPAGAAHVDLEPVHDPDAAPKRGGAGKGDGCCSL